MSVTCYPVAGKRKSFDICEAFARGCGGRLVLDGRLRAGPAMFYGIDDSNNHVWTAARAAGIEYYYCDNAYFDASRERHFRITRNRLQHDGLGTSDGRRFVALGVAIKPWREEGRHIVLAPQSMGFMRTVLGRGDWVGAARADLSGLSDRPLKLRSWSRDKGDQVRSLRADLVGAHALVTWSSAAAVTALLEGVPVVALGQCAAAPQATALEALETPVMRGDREAWAGVLADNQWSRDELRDGTAWQALKSR